MGLSRPHFPLKSFEPAGGALKSYPSGKISGLNNCYYFLLFLGMVVILKNTKDISKVKELLAEIHPKKKFDAKKFCGALKVNEDALAIQRQLRDEWN